MLYSVRKTILIPDGFSVKFHYYNIIVASTGTSTSVKTYSGIKKLFVFDEKTNHYYLFWRKSNKIFNSGMSQIKQNKINDNSFRQRCSLHRILQSMVCRYKAGITNRGTREHNYCFNYS